MAFFLTKSAADLKTAFEIDKKEIKQEDTQQQQLDDAAAIQKVLFDTEATRPIIEGVIGVTIKSATLFKSENDPSRQMNLYCTVMNRNYTKKTKVVLHCGKQPRWEEIKHLPVHVIRNYRHAFNFIKIQLWGFYTDTPDFQEEIGSLSFHLHEIIKATPLCGTYDLWNENIHIGDLDIEMTFSYGAFGYGYSYQLQEQDVKPSEKVQFSLFPRISPSYNDCEPEEAIIAFKPVRPPKVLEMFGTAELECSKDFLVDYSGEAYVPDLLVKDMGAISQVHAKYFAMNDRAARIMFLSNYLSKSRNTNETVWETIKVPQEADHPNKLYKSFVVPTSHLQDGPELKRVDSIQRPRTMTRRDMKATSPLASKKEADEQNKKWSFLSFNKSKVHPES